MHTAVNSLAAINDYKSMEQSFLDEYKENLKLQTEFDKKNDMIEKVVYNELSKQYSRLENRCISLEIKLQQGKESLQNNRQSLNQNAPEFQEFFQINELQALLEAKNVLIEKLKEHIAYLIIDSVQTVHNSNVVTSKVYKLYLQPLSPRIKNNRDAHVDYLKVTQEHTDILRDIVKQARALKPLDNALIYACKFTQRIQEFLVCVCASCPSLKYVSEKLVVVTPMNITRKVRFAESCETSKDKNTQTCKPIKKTINNSVSPSIGVSSSTEASGLKLRSNTKKDRITQTSSSNKKKNKVEDYLRIAKSSLNNKNRVSKPVCNANVKHSVLNANSELICATCNECMFDAIHDLCVRDYLNDVNARVKSKSMKSKSAKSNKKKM
ncbi:hypothetical protein Tco_0961318 [Tanacetum coccineum]